MINVVTLILMTILFSRIEFILVKLEKNIFYGEIASGFFAAPRLCSDPKSVY